MMSLMMRMRWLRWRRRRRVSNGAPPCLLSLLLELDGLLGVSLVITLHLHLSRISIAHLSSSVSGV
jgi:hypothetical protein